MKKVLCALLAEVVACSPAATCLAAENTAAKTAETEMNDTALPDLNDGSWYETMHTDFTKIQNMQQLREAGWVPSPHGLRNYEYWCDQMIEFTDNGLIVHSEQQTDHDCDVCGVQEGVFTSGIETREMVDGKSNMLFSQAFGYFEATVIVPRGSGMWSAF